MKFMLCYDIHRPGKGYHALYDELGKFKAKKVLESQWVFRRTNTNAAGLRDHFKQFIDSNDRLLVVDLSNGNWASFNSMVSINDV